MHRKIIAVIMLLTALAAVGCSESKTNIETSENAADAQTSTNYSEVEKIAEISEKESVSSEPVENIKIDATESSVNIESLIQSPKNQESQKSVNEKSMISSENNDSAKKQTEEFHQQTEVKEAMLDEEDIIFAEPAATTPQQNEPQAYVSTTESMAEDEIIVTESVIELPFVPAR